MHFDFCAEEIGLFVGIMLYFDDKQELDISMWPSTYKIRFPSKKKYIKYCNRYIQNTLQVN